MSDIAPEPVARPKLARWMFERGLKPRHATGPLRIGELSVRRYCKPFGDPERRIPDEQTMARIVAWTAGEVTPADFYPPHLSEQPPRPEGGAQQDGWAG